MIVDGVMTTWTDLTRGEIIVTSDLNRLEKIFRIYVLLPKIISFLKWTKFEFIIYEEIGYLKKKNDI